MTREEEIDVSLVTAITPPIRLNVLQWLAGCNWETEAEVHL
jgi:hypothetical protein